MKYLLILFILVLSLTAAGQVPETSGYRGKVVGAAPYINTEYNFAVTPPIGATESGKLEGSPNFLAAYSCLAPTCVARGTFIIVKPKLLDLSREAIAQAFQDQASRNKIADSIIKNLSADINPAQVSSKYLEINGRPTIRLQYDFTKDGKDQINVLSIIFVAEKKIIVGFGSLAEKSQTNEWNKISDAAINTFTLLPAKDSLTVSKPIREGITTKIISGDPGTGIAVAAPVDANRTILNYQATSLTRPEYPAAARAIRATGVVLVQVTVDGGSGNVVSASAVSGHPLLQQACVKAARLAKFKPATNGKDISGILIYNFEIPTSKP